MAKSPASNYFSKEQKKYFKLLKKHDQLRQQLHQISSDLDDKLNFFQQHVFPLQQQLAAKKEEIVRQLFFLIKSKNKAVNKSDERSVKELMSCLVDDLFESYAASGQPDKQFCDIFKFVKGVSYQKALKMEQEFDEMDEDDDYDEELDDYEDDDFIDFEDQEDIVVLYKRLIKVFHPDLEQDPGRKAQKELLMKELTSAYRDLDIQTLWTLEMEYLQSQEFPIESLSDSKLALFNKLLKMQIEQLKEDIEDVCLCEKYDPLYQLSDEDSSLHRLNLKSIANESSKDLVFFAKQQKMITEGNAMAAVEKMMEVLDIDEDDEYYSDSGDDDDFSHFHHKTRSSISITIQYR